ncbi:hypothetical protein VKT23_006459 [Stygiomarasmius scandens]|uniref:Carboxylic ester hydrolase n=1 Tax=Marasmiellus scandens TaxID=2682957 RepID=A0ABR1JSI1_9AGAR
MDVFGIPGLIAVSQLFLGAAGVNGQGPNYNLNSFNSTCSSLASQISIPGATFNFSQPVAAGANITFASRNTNCVTISGEPSSVIVPIDICRVSLFVSTSNRSGINMETWLPRNWTGRFLSTGNGGTGGCIQYRDIIYGSALGFATVGADNGHNGATGEAFLDNPDVLEDFVYRSIHTNVQVGKEITKQFYGIPHNKSYYLGCSTGGRQGLKSVQDFPEDFDGVVAGAAGNNWNNLMSWFDFLFTVTGNASSPTFIPIDKWLDIIHVDIMSQCDSIDGVEDGIIEDPNLCEYNPGRLICRNDSDSSTCITAEQAETIKRVFSSFFINGKVAYPRMQPGGENPSWTTLILGGDVVHFSADWFRFVVHSNPSLDVHTLGEADWELAEQLDPFNICTFKGDISAFKERGGKLLTYHGQADSLVSPIISELYYDHVLSTMDLSNADIDKFYRFFRISGMSHCSSGPGAWRIGQGLFGDISPGNENLSPDRNILMAMVRWVEEGVAPESILGTKFVNDSDELGVAFSRRHCKFPLRNTYDGQGILPSLRAGRVSNPT